MQRAAAAIVVIALAVGVAACSAAGLGRGADVPGTFLTTVAPPSPAPVPTPKPTPKPTPASSPSALPTLAIVGELVDVAKVTCGSGAPVLGSGRVRASADGITLAVSGGKGLYLGIEHAAGGEGQEITKDAQEVTLRIPPGDVGISCATPGAELTLAVVLRIEDPDGWYRSTMVEPVSGSCMSGEGSFTAEARGPKGDPVELAKKALVGLRPGDVVERGGYPADTGLVRIVRDGRVIGLLRYQQDPDGGWLLPSTVMCSGLSVSLE